MYLKSIIHTVICYLLSKKFKIMSAPSSDIAKSLSIPGQFILDKKLYFSTLNDMKNLGINDNFVYTYYEGMKVFCLETFKEYYWKKRASYEIGVLEEDFIYPINTLSNGIDYSNRNFNFIEYGSDNQQHLISTIPVILNEYVNFYTEKSWFIFSNDVEMTLADIKYNEMQFFDFGDPLTIENMFPGSEIKNLKLIILNNVYTIDEITASQDKQILFDIKERIYYQRTYYHQGGPSFGFTNWKRIDNVQPDWNQTDNTAPDYIKNKPTISFTQAQSDWNVTNNALPTFIKNKPAIVAPVQSNWTETNPAALSFILNKPSIPVAYSDTSKYIPLGFGICPQVQFSSKAYWG